MTTTKINLQIRNGTAAALPATLVVGQLYAATDNGKLYIGIGAGATLQLGPTLTGDVTTVGNGAFVTTIAALAVTTGKIAASAVTYAKMQDVSAASKLLGRGDGGSGSPQEITLGTGLSMSGTTLSAADIQATRAISADATVAGTDDVVYATTGVGGITATLPAASAGTVGKVYYIFKVDSGVGLLTIAPNGTNTLNGVNAGKTVANQWNGCRIQGHTATGWIVTSFTGL